MKEIKIVMNKIEIDSLKQLNAIQDLVYNFVSNIDYNINTFNFNLITYISEHLNENQRFIYLFWKLDGEVCNGGTLQIFLNLNMYTLYHLAQTKILRQNEFKKLAMYIVNTYKLMNEIFPDIQQNQIYRDRRQEAYDKYKEKCKPYDEYYYSIKVETWNVVSKLIKDNIQDFIVLER
jgi:hypothetical protein